MSPSVYIFDAYGTLFDVHAAVRRHAAALGPDADQISALWRAKQLEYSWVLTLIGRYRDFWALTEEALDYALAAFPGADGSLRPALLSAYRELDCFPEVPALMQTLKAQGKRLGILSNGSPAMLRSAVEAAGLQGIFDTVLSVDALHRYKAHPDVYEQAATHFRVYPGSISFQSSNRWDVAGAVAFGFRGVWINRSGSPDEYADLAPTVTLPSLAGLAEL
jgi:2-haloacid dehalogenase